MAEANVHFREGRQNHIAAMARQHVDGGAAHRGESGNSRGGGVSGGGTDRFNDQLRGVVTYLGNSSRHAKIQQKPRLSGMLRVDDSLAVHRHVRSLVHFRTHGRGGNLRRGATRQGQAGENQVE